MKVSDEKKYKLQNIYSIIKEFSLAMHNDFVNIGLIQQAQTETYLKPLIEIFMFFIWELDVCLFSNKQGKKVRSQCISYVLSAVVVNSRLTDEYEKINQILNKRLEEYGETERGKTKVGSPDDLLTNFLAYNINFAQKENDFFYCEGVRPLLLLSIFTQVTYGKFVLLYHARIRGYFYNIFKDCEDFMLLADEEFENRIKEADVKDKELKEELISKFIT